MDAFGLVPMLTLLHIVLQGSLSAEPLTRPILSVKPEYQEYYEGENLRLICSTFHNLTVMRNLRVQGYRFFQEDGQQIHQTAPDAYKNGVMDFEAKMNDTGSYRCAYWLEEAGRKVWSDQSRPISIQVNAAPSAPSLKYMIFDFRKTIRMECTPPPEADQIKQFRFNIDKRTVLVMAISNSSYIYNLTNEKGKEVAIVTCAYAQDLSGRIIFSRNSNPIYVDLLGVRWIRLLAVGGSFFTINGLIFLISYCISLRSRSLLQKTERTI